MKFFRNLRRNLKLNKLANKVFDSMESEAKLGKAFWKSKTFWLNVLALLNELIKVLPTVNEVIPAVPSELALPAVAAGNVVLRKLTTKPIVLSEKKY